MESVLIGAIIFLLALVGTLFYAIFKQQDKSIDVGVLNEDNVVQKKTYSFFFSPDGKLLSKSNNQSPLNNLFKIESGQHITELHRLKNIDKYFDSAIKHKKNISLKLFEELDKNVVTRRDLIFTPIFEEDEIQGVILVLQELISTNSRQAANEPNKDLEEQRNFALRQIDEIEAQKSELELAFKKSSKHHIVLQKALRKIEIQKNELESALDTINKQKIELERANQEIRESSRMKEIFLANTSHEIRTPLNAIIGFTNLLLSTKLEEHQTKYLENIKASGNNLLVVINDILDFSKIESGKLTLEQIEFDFRNLIKHTISTLSVKSQEKDIQLSFDVSNDIPQVIVGDPVRLNQILINLLGNAIKFTNPGGYVRLITTKGKTTGDKIKLLFKVEDNGIGIAHDKLQNIFQSFTQGESDTTRKYGGTGLGLSIVKQLIELQEGEITVESQPGKGTAFTFYILMLAGNDDTQSQVVHTSKKLSHEPANLMHILLVEDNIINQQLAFDTIKAWNPNIKIDVAENGSIALDKIKEIDYDLVLMDIQMPVMDGIEATKTIRKLPGSKSQTPIVAMTAHALKNEKDNCLTIGMNDYISKPFDPEDLFAKILQFANNKIEAVSQSIPSEKPRSKKPESVATTVTFNYFNTDNLVKIYQNNHDKIAKIVKMCLDSIPNELSEIQDSYNQEGWNMLRNKAHALKPKLGYLGMLTMQENAKNIELLSQKPESKEPEIEQLILEIKTYWEKATPEIEAYLESKPLN
ncbi:MAG: ATP-binding protein [Salinivirgaceae bacterium]